MSVVRFGQFQTTLTMSVMCMRVYSTTCPTHPSFHHGYLQKKNSYRSAVQHKSVDKICTRINIKGKRNLKLVAETKNERKLTLYV